MTDKEYCDKLTDFDDICCMDLDRWLSDCPVTATRFRLTKDKITEQCDMPERRSTLSRKCPVKYSVPDKNKDHKSCENVSKSTDKIICEGIDNFLLNCPYYAFVGRLDKNYLEEIKKTTNSDYCSTYEKQLIKKSTNKIVYISIGIIILLAICFIIYKIIRKS